jgi:hypothetical protein
MTLNLSFMSYHLLDETTLNNIKHAQALLLDKIDIPLVDPYICFRRLTNGSYKIYYILKAQYGVIK